MLLRPNKFNSFQYIGDIHTIIKGVTKFNMNIQENFKDITDYVMIIKIVTTKMINTLFMKCF